MTSDEIKIFKNLMKSLCFIGKKNDFFEFTISHIGDINDENIIHAIKFVWWRGRTSFSSNPGISIGHICWGKHSRIICKDIWFYGTDGNLTIDIGWYYNKMYEPCQIGGREGFLSPKCRLDSENLFIGIKVKMVELI